MVAEPLQSRVGEDKIHRSVRDPVGDIDQYLVLRRVGRAGGVDHLRRIVYTANKRFLAALEMTRTCVVSSRSVARDLYEFFLTFKINGLVIWLPRSGVGASLDAPASPSLAAGVAKVVFPRWNVGTSKINKLVFRQSLRTLDHLAGVIQGLAGDLPASQHAGDFVHAFRRSQVFDIGVGLAGAGELADQ